jgi:hypothetical protein
VNVGELLVGRRAPSRARADFVYGIVDARLTLEIDLGLIVQTAGLAFTPLERENPVRAKALDELVVGVADSIGLKVDRREDQFGLRWIVLRDGPLEELAISIGIVAEELDRARHSRALVCAAFGFGDRQQPDARSETYLVFNFERGSFYPFATSGRCRRNASRERQLAAALASDLRLEREPELWYPLWGIPLERP